MIRIKLFDKKSIIFTWALSYIAILLLPIIISVIMYFRVEKVVKDEINRSNGFYLSQVQQYMDGIADDVKRLSVEVAYNNRIQEVIPFKIPFTDEHYYKLYQCVNELKNYRISNTHVNNFFIYLKNSDNILNDKGSMGNKNFFDVYCDMSDNDYKKWIGLVKEEYKGGQFISMLKSDGTGDKKIYYIISFPSVIQSDASANFITAIDESQLTKMSTDVESINKGKLMIIDEDNKVIAGLSNDDLPKWLNYKELNKERGVIEGDYKGKRVVVSYVSSQVEKCKYIHMMPKSVFWEKLEYARKIIYVSIFACLLLGSLIAYLLLKRNYAPMDNLLQELKGIAEQNSDNESDEYQFIKKTIIKARSDREESNVRLINQNRILKTRFIEKLLKGKFGDISINDSLSTYNINFKTRYFMVMLFYIEDFSEVFLGQTKQDSLEAFTIAKFVINNILEELTLGKFQLFVTETDGMLATIVNFNDENIGNSKNDIVEIAKELQKFIQVHYRINFTVAISDIHEKIYGIAEAYNETLEAMEYKIVMGVEGIILYSNTKININKEYYYPIEREQQLINCIKSGNFESAKDVLEDVFQKNFQDKILSPQIAKCLFLNLVSTILKTINDLDTIGSGDFEEELNRIQELIYCKNVDKVKNAMTEILMVFCEEINSSRKNKNNFIKEKVEEYIINNYKDENLSISAISDFIEMHPSYVSKLYKAQSGEGILDSINKVRIEKAKQIMKMQKINLEELTKATGYSNVRTFTRAFMKIEGITPGKYKETNPIV